jgi:hypothetical protein
MRETGKARFTWAVNRASPIAELIAELLDVLPT